MDLTKRSIRTESNVIDFDKVVTDLKGRGIDAYVEQTGGNVATIFVGKVADGIAEVAVGPGSFAGPGWTRGQGDTAELCIGPDDLYGEAEVVYAEAGWTEAEVVEEVVRQLGIVRQIASV